MLLLFSAQVIPSMPALTMIRPTRKQSKKEEEKSAKKRDWCIHSFSSLGVSGLFLIQYANVSASRVESENNHPLFCSFNPPRNKVCALVSWGTRRICRVRHFVPVPGSSAVLDGQSIMFMGSTAWPYGEAWRAEDQKSPKKMR